MVTTDELLFLDYVIFNGFSWKWEILFFY